MSEEKNVTIGTHSGAFQADEALGVWMLRQLPAYKDATLIRSRDNEVLKTLTIVIDVGGVYDHSSLRYDHHQRGFFETFDGVNPTSRDGGRPEVTGPDTVTEVFKTKLSASGLVFKHYGKEIVTALHPSLASDSQALSWVYNRMYVQFMEGIDANDNGIEISDSVRYREGTGLPARVHMLNGRWNDPEGGSTEDERFLKASALCGAEFAQALGYVVTCELPARALVANALNDRANVHVSGQVIRFSNGGCPWKTHLYELERELAVSPLVKFVLYEDSRGMWRVQAVTAEGTAFTNRLGLSEPWRGLRDAALSEASGIKGTKFVHASGFIGGNETYEGALEMALKTIDPN